MERARTILSTAALCATLAIAVGCDSTKPTTTAIPPEVQEDWENVKERIDSGKYFRRVEALDEFIASKPPPILLLEAKSLREEYQKMAEKQAVIDKAFSGVEESLAAAAVVEESALWESERVVDLRPLLLRQLATDFEVHGWGSALPEPVELPGRMGRPTIYGSAARLDLPRFRESLHRLLSTFGEELSDDCVAACLNDAIDRKIFSYLGGEIFLGMGKVEDHRLDKLAEAFWLEPDETIDGVTGREYYAAFSRVPRDLWVVRRALAEFGDDKAMKAYHAVRDDMRGPQDRRVMRHYRIWTRQVGLTQALEGKVEYRIIDNYVGFWLRRMYDGSEPVVMKWLKRTLETYDPEFLASLDAPDSEAAADDTADSAEARDK